MYVMPCGREMTMDWVAEALKELGGIATILRICKTFWESHGQDIRKEGDLFHVWQYEIRWAVNLLRRNGVLRVGAGRGVWELA